MKKVYIYVLFDPRKPNLIRYVGQSVTPYVRQLQHCKEKSKSKKAKWLETMLLDGILPGMNIIEVTTPEKADAREKLWIARFGLTGRVLMNTMHNTSSAFIDSEYNVEDQNLELLEALNHNQK